MTCTNCSKNKCQRDCACPLSAVDVSLKDPDSLTILINSNGVTTEFNTKRLQENGETDTSLNVDVAKRVLKFIAEKHIDSLTAAELGSILHLADIGDVSTKGVEQGSTLVYRKNDNCPSGCVGTNNLWEPWNALDASNQTASAQYVSVYDAEGNPLALGRPANPNQFYNLGWNGAGQLSYQQPRRATVVGPNAYQLYMDGDTGEIYGVPTGGNV